MRHRRRVKYFGVKSAHRKAMFRNMVTSFFEHGRIKTTVPRAKELRRWAEKMITLAKDGSLHARRQALSVIMDKAIVAKLFNEIAPMMAERRGGYTRIVRIGPRRGDGAMMCYIELVTESPTAKDKPQKEASDKTEAMDAAPTVIPSAQESPEEETATASDQGEKKDDIKSEAEETGQEESASTEDDTTVVDKGAQETEDEESDEQAVSSSDEAQDESSAKDGGSGNNENTTDQGNEPAKAEDGTSTSDSSEEKNN